MNNQQFALFENSDLVYLDSEYINCEIISLPKKYKPHVLSMTMQKNLPYKNAFNYFVGRVLLTRDQERCFCAIFCFALDSFV